MVLIGLLLSLGVGYAAGILFFFARGLKPVARSVAFVLLGVIVLGSALGLGAESIAVRCVAAGLLLIIFLLHMWDLHMDPDRGTRLSLWAYIVFLGDYAWSVARVSDGYGVGLPFKRRAIDAVKHVVGLGTVSAVTVGVFKVGWATYPFWLEHAVKSTCLAAWTIRAFQANTALWRLAGAPAAFFTTRNVLWARSPADFWRRWNRPMYRWLLENVYRPLGGRQKRRLAALATSAVSGLLHEHLFAVTFRRISGYVMAFFLLHGLAVVLTHRLQPAGRWLIPAIILTFSFNTLSTVLLLVPINEHLSVYANEVPLWIH